MFNERVHTTSRATQRDATRAKILAQALDLFASKGFAQTTMRDIARAAGVSLGLSYRYFAQKEHIALALYATIAQDLETFAQDLAPASTGERFAALMREKLRLITPHREAIAAIFAASIVQAPGGAPDASPLSAAHRPIRERMRRIFMRAAGEGPDGDDLTTLLYALHLALILTWLLDRSPDAGASQALVGLCGAMIDRASVPALRPVIAPVLKMIAAAVGQFINVAA